MSYKKVAKQAIAEKVKRLEAWNAELEAENARLRDKSPLFLINRLRLVGISFAYFGQKPDSCLDLIREEFGDTIADTLGKAFHDMSSAPISQEALRDLEQAMRSGPPGLKKRP